MGKRVASYFDENPSHNQAKNKITTSGAIKIKLIATDVDRAAPIQCLKTQLPVAPQPPKNATAQPTPTIQPMKEAAMPHMDNTNS